MPKSDHLSKHIQIQRKAQKKKGNWQQHKGKQAMLHCTCARCKLCKLATLTQHREQTVRPTEGWRVFLCRDEHCFCLCCVCVSGLPAGTCSWIGSNPGRGCNVPSLRMWSRATGPGLKGRDSLCSLCVLKPCLVYKSTSPGLATAHLLALHEGSKTGTTKMGCWAVGTGESACVTSSLPPPILLEWAENHNQRSYFRIWHRIWVLTKGFFS